MSQPTMPERMAVVEIEVKHLSAEVKTVKDALEAHSKKSEDNFSEIRDILSPLVTFINHLPKLALAALVIFLLGVAVASGNAVKILEWISVLFK